MVGKKGRGRRGAWFLNKGGKLRGGSDGGDGWCFWGFVDVGITVLIECRVHRPMLDLKQMMFFYSPLPNSNPSLPTYRTIFRN